jgi:Cu/Ag efflux pump CusA
MAIVILCGLVTSTFLNMIVVPTLYLKYGGGQSRASAANRAEAW